MREVVRSETQPPCFVDLFGGAGGFSQGMRDAGFEHLVGVEMDALVARTYAANHGHVLVRDVREVTAADLAPFVGSRRLTALVASPPCTSFSSCGPRAPGDPRDALYAEVLRLARDLDPRWIVLENVPGFLTKRVEGRRAIDRLLEDLRAEGYHAEHRLLSADEYGVPQRRRRVIVVAARDAADVVFPAPDRGYDPAVGPHLLDEGAVPEKYFALPHLVEYYLSKPRFVRYLDPSQPCCTLRACYHKNRGADAVVRCPSGRLRRLTEAEAAAVQSFPPGYEFAGSMSAVYRQIGNAIPARLAEHVGRALLDSLAPE